MPDLQELVDDLADAIGRPVSVEDRRWRLMAFSAYTDHEDRVREASILARAAPPEVAAWLETLRLDAATGLVDTQANPDIGIGPRTCAPIRHDGVLLGFLWIIPGGRPLDAEERQAVVETAAAAGTALWLRRVAAREAQERVAGVLGRLLDDPAPETRARAVAELAELEGWDPDARFAVALGAAADEESGTEAADRARRRWRAGDLVWRAEHGRVTALARLAGGDDPAALARELQRAGAPCAAAAAAAGLDRAREALGVAADALLVIRRLRHLGPAAAASELGAWPAVARLWTSSGRPAMPEPLPALLAERHGGDLVVALEAMLDAGGDVAAAARALHLHRATLYRRLQRAEALTGLDLRSGDDRLRVHLALRMWRLAASPRA